MSAHALRTGAQAPRHFGVAQGSDSTAVEPRWRRGEDRAETLRPANLASPVALEPHWQASIESATD